MVHPGPSASQMQGSDPLLPLTKTTGLDPFWTGQKLTRHVVQLLPHCTIPPPPLFRSPCPLYAGYLFMMKRVWSVSVQFSCYWNAFLQRYCTVEQYQFVIAFITRTLTARRESQWIALIKIPVESIQVILFLPCWKRMESNHHLRKLDATYSPKK